MYYQINYGLLFLDLLVTAFAYLGIPLIICSIVFHKKQYVRYTRIIVINAIVVFFLFSFITYINGNGVSRGVSTLLWSGIAYAICRGTYDKKQNICPNCKKPSPGEFCTHCGAKLKEEPLTASEKHAKVIKQANCIVRLDLNQIETEWTVFEVYIDDNPHFISCKKDSGFDLSLGEHHIYYKDWMKKVPVLDFSIGENEVVRIVCSLVDKTHITATVADRLPKAVESETSSASEMI